MECQIKSKKVVLGASVFIENLSILSTFLFTFITYFISFHLLIYLLFLCCICPESDKICCCFFVFCFVVFCLFVVVFVCLLLFFS